jgi:hypothetical protein
MDHLDVLFVMEEVEEGFGGDRAKVRHLHIILDREVEEVMDVLPVLA